MRELMAWLMLGLAPLLATRLHAEAPGKLQPLSPAGENAAETQPTDKPADHDPAKADDTQANFFDFSRILGPKDAALYNEVTNPLNTRNYLKYAAGKHYFSNRLPYPYGQNGVPEPLLRHGVVHPALSPWYKLTYEAEKKIDLHLNISYTIWMQWASATMNAPGKATPNHMTNGRLDVGGYWKLPENAVGKSRVNFLIRQGTNYGWSTGTTLDTSIGDISGVNGGYNPSICLDYLNYEQDFFDGALSVQAGKVLPGMYLFVSPVADDETSQFTNEMLDGTPTTIISNYAPGVIVRLNEVLGNKDLYIYAAAMDMADSRTTAMGGLCDGKYGTVVEFGYRPKFNDLQGNYGLDLWYSDNTDFGSRSGMGFAVNANQEVIKNCILFATYAYNGRESYTQEHQLAGGVGIIEPFNRRGEMFGFGGGWARATNNGRNEGVIETFYRFQLTDAIQFSPDLQVILNPAENPDDNCVFVAGARFKIQF